MTKVKVRYVCQECGHESLKWMGRCPNCNKWNSFVEEARPTSTGKNESAHISSSALKPIPVTEVEFLKDERFSTNIAEFDRVLGGGVVPGSLILLGGDPGIGKSTILLQVTYELSETCGPVLYISGEESIKQVRLRAERLKALSKNLLVCSETDIETIIALIEEISPRVVVVDSIQTTFSSELPSAPGSVGQIRECAARLLEIAKRDGISIFLVGHVTKSGVIAGPRVLEHMVDTVLYFEGERHHSYRVIRAVKNRFGSTNEIGLFEMGENGLRAVDNPSEIFLAERSSGVPGSVVVAAMEGTRPLLVEVQALVGQTPFGGTPRRMTTGVDYNRASIILAVLEKRVGLTLQNQDIYLNVVGGVKIDEPAADLGIAVAIASSLRNKAADPRSVIIGEVGLSGEVRAVTHLGKRIREAAKLGFTRFIVPRNNMKKLQYDDADGGGKGLAELDIESVEAVAKAVEIMLSA